MELSDRLSTVVAYLRMETKFMSICMILRSLLTNGHPHGTASLRFSVPVDFFEVEGCVGTCKFIIEVLKFQQNPDEAFPDKAIDVKPFLVFVETKLQEARDRVRERCAGAPHGSKWEDLDEVLYHLPSEGVVVATGNGGVVTLHKFKANILMDIFKGTQEERELAKE